MTALNSIRPQLTFALFSYNQERFIRETVESAFAQTYSPLQIILSDDGSKDGTFEIMSRMAAGYRGPHEILLNRNAPNLGIGAHVSKVIGIGKGQLVVGLAGDDTCVPDRTEKLFKHWDAAGRPECVMYSDAWETDEAGAITGEACLPADRKTSLFDVLKGAPAPIIGCTQAWHRSLVDFFGPIPTDVMNEDGALWFRASLLGKVLHLPEKLVRHRLHGSNTGSGGYAENATGSRWLELFARSLRRQAAVNRCNLVDLAAFRSKGGKLEGLDRIERSLKRWHSSSQAGEIICTAQGWKRLAHVPAYLLNAPTLTHWKLLPRMLCPNLFGGGKRRSQPAMKAVGQN